MAELPRGTVQEGLPNMTTTIDTQVQRMVSTTRANFALPDMIPVLDRLLAEGEPVSVTRLAAAGGWPVEQVHAQLERQPGTDWDDHGRIAGFAVSLRPTPHTFQFDGRILYGFCATAVLELPIILGRKGVAESTCPATGQQIHVELTPDRILQVDPSEAVVSKVRPAEAVTDVRAEICDLGNFFSSPAAAADWLKHHPDGQVASIADEFTVTQRAMRELGWTAPQHSETAR